MGYLISAMYGMTVGLRRRIVKSVLESQPESFAARAAVRERAGHGRAARSSPRSGSRQASEQNVGYKLGPTSSDAAATVCRRVPATRPPVIGAGVMGDLWAEWRAEDTRYYGSRGPG